MTTHPAVQALATRVDARVREVTGIAARSALGGGPEWDSVLQSLAISPLPLDARASYLASGMPMSRGALPIEVRRVLERVQADARRELSALANGGADDSACDELGATLRDLADREMRAYIQAIRPPAQTSSIFKNALASTPRYAATAAGVSTTKCSACGAARADLAVEVCQFCGASFYEKAGHR